MKHVGDITKLHGWDIEPVDCITGGSPCQDLSLAGKRAGLAGERSGLFMEQIRLIKEMRDATRHTMAVPRPRYMVWENVAGAFSSNGGKDFGAVLEETARIADPDAPAVPVPEKGRWPKAGCIYSEVGKWSIAWRLHDAQHWGVPQRRKRIALVADFGGMSAPEVLFERKGLRWDTEQGETERQGAAGNPAAGTGKAISFQERAGKPGGGKGILIQDEHVGALSTLNKQSVFGIGCYNSEGMKSDNPHAGIYEADTARTLDLNGGNPACNQGGMAVVAIEGNGSRPSHRGDGYSDENEPMFTLNTTEQHAIAYGIDQQGGKGGANYTENIAPTMAADSHGTPHAVAVMNYKADGAEGDGYSAEGDAMFTLNTIERHAVAYGLEPGIAAREGGHIYKDVSGTLRAEPGDNRMAVALENHPNDSRLKISGDTVQTLSGRMGTGGNNTPMVMAVGNGQVNQSYSDKAGTLNCMHEQQAVVIGIDRAAFNQGQNALFKPQFDKELSASVIARGPNAVATHTVRRLTPTECERLQGFPDGWTDIGEWKDSKGKVHQTADSARYKALGNSIALPFWFYLLRRISAQYERPATLGSLFDGISGFCLCWERCNGGGTARWSSEVEDFCIAVCKKHFGDEETGMTGDVGQYL